MSPGAAFEIRKIESLEVSLAFEVIRATAYWLESLGKRQRVGRTPLASFENWQEQGVNFGVWNREQLAGIFSLPNPLGCTNFHR